MAVSTAMIISTARAGNGTMTPGGSATRSRTSTPASATDRSFVGRLLGDNRLVVGCDERLPDLIQHQHGTPSRFSVKLNIRNKRNDVG